MKPIAVACHTGAKGTRSPPEPRMMRHRKARVGNVRVARVTDSRYSQGLAPRRSAKNSAGSTPRSAQ